MNKYLYKKGYLSIEYVIVASIVFLFSIAGFVWMRQEYGSYSNSLGDKIAAREEFVGQHVTSYHPTTTNSVNMDSWIEGDSNSGLVDNYTHVTAIDFVDGDSYNIKVGEVCYVEATTTPTFATNDKIVWRVVSGGSSIIPVNFDTSTVQVTGAAPGKSIIEAMTVDGSKVTKYAYITVIQPVSGITLNATKTVISASSHEVAYVNATVTPSDATETRVDWSFGNGGIGSECLKMETSDNTNTVKLTAVRGCGSTKTKIIGKTLDGGFTSEIEITVTD